MKGYHEKQPVLLRKILEKLTEFKVDPKRFEIHKEMVSCAILFNIKLPESSLMIHIFY